MSNSAPFASLDSLFVYTDEDLTLPVEQEVDLIAAAKAGDPDAQWTLARAYGPALRSAVRRFGKGTSEAPAMGIGNADLDLADVQATAVVAFLEAIAEHDETKSPRLAGRIAQRLSRALADEFTAVAAFTVPERTLSRFYGILRAADGDETAAEALAPEKGMSREVFRDVLAAVRGTGSLDEHLDGDTPGAYGPVFSSSPVTDAEDQILVRVALASVDDEEERICRLSYGFTEYDPQPDAEIAHRMGLTRPTVQRKRGKALGKMRKALGVTHVGGVA